uniref:Uncharacterized protein n=1 Tax=Megaselia scalaris TaxID=36166 RepID=T1GS20_MEGSC
MKNGKNSGRICISSAVDLGRRRGKSRKGGRVANFQPQLNQSEKPTEAIVALKKIQIRFDFATHSSKINNIGNNL